MFSEKRTMDRNELSSRIKAEALRLGFFACGIARAEAVGSQAADSLRQWLDGGGQAGMDYMGNHTDMRLDPRLLMPSVRSIVSVALNYAPARHMDGSGYQIAAYAYGQDYHDIVKAKLRQLAAAVFGEGQMKDGENMRVFCDSAPVLERYWAERAGLGWTGRNHLLIIPHAGTQFFLGELFLDVELAFDQPMQSRCGSCHRCIDACPTRALGDVPPTPDSPHSPFCAERCLSYQTIENRGPLSDEAVAAMGNTIYGCDRCQQACPWNRFAQPTAEPLLQPRDELMAMQKEDWQHLSVEKYRQLFKGSAVKRAKYEGLMRNIEAAARQESDD